MKFSVNVGIFKKSIMPAVIVATKGIIKDCEDSGNITINSDDSNISISAYGGRVGISISLSNNDDPNLNYEVYDNGSATVNANDFVRSLDSFPPDRKITISKSGREFKISSGEDVQGVPVINKDVDVPEPASKFKNEISLTRDVFLDGISKVFFAAGEEKGREVYLHWVLKVDDDYARFSAGTGGRFAIWRVEGSDFIKHQHPTEILFHRSYTPVVESILKEYGGDYVVIKQSEDNDIPQILISSGDVELVIVGIDPTIEWPNIDSLLNSKKTYRFVTNSCDWEYPVKGILATFNEDFKAEHAVHPAVMEIDFKNKELILVSDSFMKSARKINIENVEYKGDLDKLSYRAASGYIAEISLKSNKEDEVVIEIIDDKSPLIYTLPEISKLGLTSQMTVIFAPLFKI